MFTSLICFGVWRQDLSQTSLPLTKTVLAQVLGLQASPAHPVDMFALKARLMPIASPDVLNGPWYSVSSAGWLQDSWLKEQHLCQISWYPSSKALGPLVMLKAGSSFSTYVDMTAWLWLGNSQKGCPLQEHWVRDWFLGLDGVVVTQIQSLVISPASWLSAWGTLSGLPIRNFQDFALGFLGTEAATELLRMSPKGLG